MFFLNEHMVYHIWQYISSKSDKYSYSLINKNFYQYVKNILFREEEKYINSLMILKKNIDIKNIDLYKKFYLPYIRISTWNYYIKNNIEIFENHPSVSLFNQINTSFEICKINGDKEKYYQEIKDGIITFNQNDDYYLAKIHQYSFDSEIEFDNYYDIRYNNCLSSSYTQIERNVIILYKNGLILNKYDVLVDYDYVDYDYEDECEEIEFEKFIEENTNLKIKIDPIIQQKDNYDKLTCRDQIFKCYIDIENELYLNK